MKKQILFTIIALIGLAIISRLIPHWPNFTAMIAVAFTGGIYLGKRSQALLLPLLIIFLSDLVINNTLFWDGSFTLLTSGFTYIYAAYILVALFGSASRTQSLAIKGLGAISGSLLFYLVTNFGVWLGSPYYSQDLMGLMNSYMAGLPFLLNSAASTLLYGALIVAGYRAFVLAPNNKVAA